MEKLTDKILRAIEIIVDGKLRKLKTDTTFISVIYGINQEKNSYTIIKEKTPYEVKCAIPCLDLKIGQNVWVKIPNGELRYMHICGVCEKK